VRLKKLNEALLIVILIMTALVAAVVVFKAYDVYETDREQRQQDEAVLYARNAEAQSRVQEMEEEIQALSQNKQELNEFIASINEAAASETLSASDNSSISEDSVSANTLSGNDFLWDGFTISDNSISDNSISENSISGNSISGNSISGNSISGNAISGNDVLRNGFTVSGNTISGIITLEERRQLRTSMEETEEVNAADRKLLSESKIDFSGKKIACLGDSITEAANLDSEENYKQYAYPARMQEILGAEEVYNLGIGGSSIGRYWADAFVDRYQDIPEDSDIIIVMGGTNDGFCVSEDEFGSLESREYRTFCGDLDELMRGLRDDYPDADIFFVTPLPNILQDYLMSERDYLLPQRNFVDVIMIMAQEYGFGVIDLYDSNILDSHDADIVANYMPDGVHANHEGYQILAEHLAASLVAFYDGE
jgi:lysophospholipase L1-like esterase/Tfp pilus assembly protein PilX